MVLSLASTIDFLDNNIAIARSTGKQLKVCPLSSSQRNSKIQSSFLEGPLSETPLLATGTAGTW